MKMRKPSPLLLFLSLMLILNPPLFMIRLVQVRGDVAEVSPGKIPPQGRNLYLDEANETQAKVEFSKGIVLQETVGDLLFNVTTQVRRRTIAVYIPPEFKVGRDLTYVWTSVTNDYRYISLSTLSDRDPIAPRWQRILVSNGTGGIISGSHYIRIFNVTAPSIVGRYFFKVYVDGFSIGAKNFPTLVVSADPNPAYISGAVLDGGWDPLRHGRPVYVKGGQGGRVVAEGITSEGRIITAQAFFNASAEGKYILYGLAAGTYRLTASCAGYSNSTRPDPVTVVSGQSLENVDIYVYPSPKIQGIVWSKCSGIPHPWDPISVHSGPYEGAALTYVGTGTFPGYDLIYALRGDGTSDFLRYDSISDRWEVKRHTPGSVGPGGALAFDGVQYIYALQGGGSTAFWRYDVLNDQWQAMENTPGIVGGGGALTFNLKDGLIYAIGGGETDNFWCYDPLTNSWKALSPTPGKVGAGGALVSDLEGRLYAFRGMGTTDFWCYDPSTGAWTPLPTGPAASSGASLTFDGAQYIYALQGGGSNTFWRFDITGNSWSMLSNVPGSIGPGGALTFDRSNGMIYTLLGGRLTSANFYEYDPFLNTWKALRDLPCVSPRPISIEILDALGDSKYVLQNYTDPYSDRFDFTYEGLTEFDGHIPQDGAGYLSGISPGSYIVEVWVNQYIQPDIVQLPGTYEEITGVWVQLPSQTLTVTVQLEVQRTGVAEILVHFRDPWSKSLTPVESDRTLTVALYDHNRELRAQNSTRVTAGSTSSLVVLTGFLGTLRDYGLPADTYLIGVTVTGFYQASDAFITLSLCGAKGEMSLDMFKSGSLNVTIRSVDSQLPPVPRNWRYPGSPIKVEVRDRYGVEVVASNITRQRPLSQSVTLSVTGLRTGTYSIYVYTFGYIQSNNYIVSVTDGAVTDVAVNVVIGGELDLTVLLEKEDIPAVVDTYPFSPRVPVRVQVIDAYGQFTAANITFISPSQNLFNVRLAGFRNYAGSYSEQRWANYYDTTDGAQQNDYGLPAGSYTFLIYVPGYAQREEIVVTLPQGGVSSVTLHLDRMAHFLGHVSSFNKFDEMVPLNWVTVDAIGDQTSGFTSTLDGSFDLWLEEGHYLIILSLDGYAAVSQEVSLPKGSDIPMEFYMEPLIP
jgi:hypothetical protein